MGLSGSDKDDVRVKGVDSGGTDRLIEAVIDGATYRLAVDAQISGGNGLIYNSALDANKIYSVTALVNASASSEYNPILLLKNPSGSGKKIYILTATGNATISNERTLFGAHYNPTITTNGTSLGVVNRTIGGGGASSVILAYTLPTVSARGTDLSWAQSGENTDEMQLVGMEMTTLTPNQNILITAKPKSNNRVQTCTVVWFEEDN